jgi:hypothetical protein
MEGARDILKATLLSKRCVRLSERQIENLPITAQRDEYYDSSVSRCYRHTEDKVTTLMGVRDSTTETS